MTGKPVKVVVIDIDKINILNPRVRNKKIFGAMKDNISQVGLKKPITVKLSSSAEGKEYDLVCGQGRLEALIACGETEVPAIVVDATEEQALIMSLVENLARRKYRAMDLLQAVEILRKQGYNVETIAQKTGLSVSYIHAVLHLMEKGEERLVAAVEAGKIAIGVAMKIAHSEDGDLQEVLRELYETKQLRGQKLLLARKLVETRRTGGKAYSGTRGPGKADRMVSSRDILRVFQKEANRKKIVARKAQAVSAHLVCVTEAMKQLFAEEHFLTLLRAEGLDTLPRPVADLTHRGETNV